MKITELPAYKRLEESFERKGYSQGIEDNMPIYRWDNVKRIPANLTSGHYVYAIRQGDIKFRDIPEEYRTREFFLHTLSGVQRDIVEYVKTHPEKFDKQFFKDHIATNYYGLMFELNDFEYMPLEYIDEEMVACAMFKTVKMQYDEGRNGYIEWFYSVYRRKPEVLTQELYILGARCFAKIRHGKNEFLDITDITPEKYRTPEFYFALCIRNRTPVMEDIPESVLTTNFLADLLKESTENIQCFSEIALEKEILIVKKGIVKFWKILKYWRNVKFRPIIKFWQVALINNGYQIRNIPLNEERVEFFTSMYDKDSFEYVYGFKEHYKRSL